MNISDRHCFYKPVSWIYVERRALPYEMTKRILSVFPEAELILIDHYKEIFARPRQDVGGQHLSGQLILAVKEGQLIYQGAPVCQDFGEDHFYYTSCQMNCVFDCEYCFLKGVYPSGYRVLFVNAQDFLEETKKLLAEHPVYISISYDTDLLAMEKLTGYVRAWQDLASSEPDLRVEVRTKSAAANMWDALSPWPGMIYAFTMSPQPVVDRFEHGTPSLARRIAAAAEGLRRGFAVRLCFDPMICLTGWRAAYGQMLEEISEGLPLDQVRDFSVGSFRVSQDYLKRMRRLMPRSAVVQYPYENIDGVYQYPPALAEEMETFVENGLKALAPGKGVYRWKEQI